MVKINVSFRQTRFHGSLSKVIELAAVPFIGCYVEYESGWGLESVKSVSILKDSIELDYYGPQFSDEEIRSLVALGWEAYGWIDGASGDAAK